MTKRFALSLLLTGVLLTGGCATKKYVRTTTAPIQAKVDQVGDHSTRNAAAIDEARKEIKSVDERSESGISLAKERALTAEGRANEALTKATEAGTKATEAGSLASDARSASERNSREIAMVRQLVASIDDYKPHAETTVLFKFGQHELTPEAQQQLDKLIADKGVLKRYVISVRG